jgi:hypothetical protein
MALHDNAVVTAALGYVYVGPVGTARPSPADLKTMDVLTFGSDTSYTLVVTGAPTGGTFTLKTGGTGAGTETGAIAFNATGDQIRAELEKLTAIGTGNVIGKGTLADPAGVTITDVGKLQTGSAVALSATTTGLTGGTTPGVTVTKVPLAAGGAWKNIGHTSRDDLPEFGFDGGDTEVRGSWQNASLREVVTEQAADYCTIRLLQFDADAMELYYGLNKSTTPGVFGVADGTAVPVEKSLFMVIVDGAHRVGFYSPKSSFRRDDSIQLAVDEFAAFPIRATFMSSGSPTKYEWLTGE